MSTSTMHAPTTLVIEQIDPTTLLVDTNVREDLHLDKPFLRSIKEHGVLVPITATRTPDGIRVHAGHRRVAAAILADLPTVPVVIADRDVDEITRIVEQMAENDHRASITTSERISAVNQLALLGVSASSIARRTNRPRREVDAALAIGDDAAAAKVAETHTLQVAAWTVEFADDPDAVARIIDAAEYDGEGAARHEVERLRQARAANDALAEVAQALRERDPEIVVLTEHPGYSNREAANIDLLDGVGPKNHRACPHRALLVERSYHDTGKNITQASNGTAVRVSEWCTDWRAAGHAHKHHTATTPTSASSSTGDADERADAARTERRRVVAGNRDWQAAQVVRTEWIDTLLARKALPKDAISVIAEAAKHTSLRIGYTDRDLPVATTADATRALLRVALTTLEAEAQRGDWRDHTHPRPGTQALLVALIAWGYTASPVEEAAAGLTAYTAPDKQ